MRWWPANAACRARSFAWQRNLSCISSVGDPKILENPKNYHSVARSRQIKPRFSALSLDQQSRSASWLPEVVQNVKLWGGSGFLLSNLHDTVGLPYGVAFASLAVGVRILLFPVVVNGAHAAARFAKVLPEIQFLLGLYQNDRKELVKKGASWAEKTILLQTNLKTLSGLYKLHKIHPLAVFASPVLQLPFFWYLATDLRKIVNGLDPMLAQRLVDAQDGGWIPDWTEPDPWYALPVAAGLALYGNVEVATGRRSLMTGGTGSGDQPEPGILLKDIFQSFAVFMPCFTCQLPAGVQVYIVTSFCLTAVQSAALRNAGFRETVGLPPLVTSPGANRGLYAEEFVRLKQMEQRAANLRPPNTPILGKHGILADKWTVSFAGRHRESSIRLEPSLGRPESVKPISLVCERPQHPLVPPGIQGVSQLQDLSLSKHPPQPGTGLKLSPRGKKRKTRKRHK